MFDLFLGFHNSRIGGGVRLLWPKVPPRLRVHDL